MTNDEIKELLRDLAQKAEEEGEVKSRKIRISLTPQEPERETKKQAEDKKDDSVSDTGDSPGTDEDEPDVQQESAGRRGLFAALKDRIRAPKKRREDPDDEEDMDGPEPDEEAGGREEDPDKSSAEEPGEETPPASGIEPDGTVLKPEPDEEAPEEDVSVSEKGRKKHRKKSDGNGGRVSYVGEVSHTRDGTPVEPAEFDSDAADFIDDETHKAMEAALQKQKVDLRHRVRTVLRALKAKGIGRRELIMIAAGIVLCLLIAAVALSVTANRRKSEHVTVDEGLTITVEKEPSEWCTHGEVVLGIRTNSPMQSILINGSSAVYSGSTKTLVTLDADTDVLDVMVVSEAEVLNASVQLQHIDSHDPEIEVAVEDGKVHLNVTDNGSGLAGVWYGVKEAFLEVPMYQPYTEPFVPEDGKTYAYFAADKAGNTTTPVLTSLIPAKAVIPASTQISLFPGETCDLKIETEPAGGYVNGLTINVRDESVVTLQEDGTLLAMEDGETDVEISAEGLPTVTCHVTVRSSASLTISAIGDVTLGDDVNFSPLNSFTTVYSMQGSSYFFDNVRAIFNEDDITFANLEGTLTTQGTRADKQYAFRGDPSYTAILQDGSIEAVTLANNHSSDYGEISLTDTEKYLDEAGIDWCKDDKIVIREVNGVKVALIGIYVLNEGEAKASQVESTIAQAQDEGAKIIVVAFHWGNERETSPDAVQQKLGRLAIDCGADLVVGHHPHVLQGIEKYAGKYICYSLANFCFGGNANPTDMDTMIFQQTFQIKRGGEVEAGDAKVIPCKVSSTDSWNNYQPTPAAGEEAQRIMDRINGLCEPYKTSF